MLWSYIARASSGYVNLEELSLVSESFQSHPNINMRSQISHVSGDGIRALVDSFCERYQQQPGVYRPLKLSLIGACALGHDSVSALLRLPLLTELNITGCNKISAMDKMRLVAKVKAGREFLEAKGIVIDRTWGDEFNTDFSLSAWKAN